MIEHMTLAQLLAGYVLLSLVVGVLLGQAIRFGTEEPKDDA